MRLLILGGGQLALMMIWESARLPAEIYVYDENPEAPALRAGRAVQDPLAAVDLADYVTFEFENVDFRVAEYAERRGKLRPPLEYLSIKRSRIDERNFLNSLGIPTPRWAVAKGGEEAVKMAETFGRAVVKEPSGGYDGKGQYVYPSMAGRIRQLRGELLVEELVDIKREFSIVAARTEDGDIYYYPPAQNYYVDGILVWSFAPTQAPKEAEEVVAKIAEARKYVGVLAVEFFEARDGRILVNEIAPRVHNTGHWTLETDVSQFETHVRAVLGLGLRLPRYTPSVAMVNILGLNAEEIPWVELEKLGRVYWYHKARATPRRKMGHVNVTGADVSDAVKKALRVLAMLYGRRFPRLVLKERDRMAVKA
ncbi:5-(carboxyamino)imidazole ribonucleotide synthase [Thermoproteus tenax]|uniref:N5-carboxyaminoimidazole ribonucleotide synthase n=1 Tax=Thermoproteus tenax (strain ATCC 35583 / DSM 2078 / JCM 9277 / NBRC 100435 / Kra 1) TaxID=768679 RepID=G4RLY8_THETK|nr:5-(carboxyamino)imidazole ribonucleotide synthase [Thermoproteus tenax]CCC82583.1 phosphoribosylaminoimidazole carboxylase ATPase subunit [Thermoproteus tenax Kra 1]